MKTQSTKVTFWKQSQEEIKENKEIEPLEIKDGLFHQLSINEFFLSLTNHLTLPLCTKHQTYPKFGTKTPINKNKSLKF